MRERRTGQAERLGELLERGQRLALVGQPARLLARERLARVAGGEGEQLALLAALRDAQVDRPAAALGEERLEDGASRRRPPAGRPRAGSSRRGRSTARGSWSGPRRRSPRGRRRAGRRRARSSCRRGSRTAGWPPGCPGAPGRAGRARSWRRRPSSGSPSSARWPGSCRAGRPPARSRSARRRPPSRRSSALTRVSWRPSRKSSTWSMSAR